MKIARRDATSETRSVAASHVIVKIHAFVPRVRLRTLPLRLFSAFRGPNFFCGNPSSQSPLLTAHADAARVSRLCLAKEMSFTREIGAPFTLASLPRSKSSGGGHAQSSSVCSISGTKKRKRTEVAVALDGEGIFIYSVGL